VTASALVLCLLQVPTSGAAGAVTPSADSRAQGVTARVSASVYTGGTDEATSDDSRSDGGTRSGSYGDSGAAGHRLLALVRSTASSIAAPVSLAQPLARCSAHKAVRFYRAAVNRWRAKTGAGVTTSGRRPVKGGSRATCPRYLAHVLQRKAFQARRKHERWHAYHYAWRTWLPDKWQRIGACETGYGRRPGDWRWNSGTYQGAFGFYYGSWDAFVPRADRKAGPYPSEAYNATPRQQYEVALAIWRAYGFSGWGCRGA